MPRQREEAQKHPVRCGKRLLLMENLGAVIDFVSSWFLNKWQSKRLMCFNLLLVFLSALYCGLLAHSVIDVVWVFAIKYGCLPVQKGQCNNQIASAMKASKHQKVRCLGNVMAMAPLGWSSINKGIHYYCFNCLTINDSEIMMLSGWELYHASNFAWFSTSLAFHLNDTPSVVTQNNVISNFLLSTKYLGWVSTHCDIIMGHSINEFDVLIQGNLAVLST